jgi:hypothetical protein
MNAVQLVYLPRAMANTDTDALVVVSHIEQAKTVFREQMEQAKRIQPLKVKIPRRVEFVLNINLESDSSASQTMDWICERYGGKALNVILDAISLVHYPAALAASEETADLCNNQIHRSIFVFNSMMSMAMAQVKPTEEMIMLMLRAWSEPQNQLDTYVQKDTTADISSGDVAENATAEETEDDDDDDDFTPPIYDLDFDN